MGPMAKAPIKDGRSLMSTFIKVGANQGKGNSKNMRINEITPKTEIFTMVFVFHVSLLIVYIKSLQIIIFFRDYTLNYRSFITQNTPKNNLRGNVRLHKKAYASSSIQTL